MPADDRITPAMLVEQGDRHDAAFTRKTLLPSDSAVESDPDEVDAVCRIERGLRRAVLTENQNIAPGECDDIDACFRLIGIADTDAGEELLPENRLGIR